MSQLRSNIVRAGLEALYFSGAHHLLRPLLAGVGTIFMLHRVRPVRKDAFQPNSHLEITPDFLRAVLAHVRELDVDIVTLDEMHRRMRERNFARRFACFTFDDGYRDNRDFALPVMRDFSAPFTIYVPSDFASGTGKLWWVALERLIAKVDFLDVPMHGAQMRFDCRDTAAKREAFVTVHDWLRALPADTDVNRTVSDLCRRHGLDDGPIARELCMSWQELQTFAVDPLVTIGGHTLSHCNLAKCTSDLAEREIAANRADIEAKLDRPVAHFAYPYGDKAAAGTRDFAIVRKLGFRTAVTTRPGMLFPENAEHMTALPRLSLNGNYQDERLLKVLTSGAPTAVWNGFRRIDAA
ncbi:polysaccharide deacetylase family protein [Bradyrhizobium sp. LHD-71]|uniref:polysaccharide deacetylase family protein n=1 Tax=Bradyrhizobium sp. LHD-71 TaxID=3072141 RepID=UPI00280E025B|nr:polysaccharide deacetylase family protein [Bradyrhizobium sp. LHD-71]MDQ8730302.1 polysaccharide deacetylase family protein [Bradyrhizobium sp. LHD-71]